MKLATRAAAITLTAGIVLLSGCASFPAATLKDVQLPDTRHYSHKPSAYFDVKFYRGEPGGAAMEIPIAAQQARAVVERVAQESGLFSRVTTDTAAQSGMDHVIQLSFYNHGSTGAAMISGFITGFTFGVIPGAATDNYTLVTQESQPGAAASPALTSNDSVRTWIGLVFLPLAANTPKKAMDQTFEEMTRDALRQLAEQQRLRLSQRGNYVELIES